MKFSANIISATVYLFVGSSCSRVVEGADPYMVVRIACQSLNFSLSYFVFTRSLRSAQSSGRWAGYDVEILQSERASV